METEEVKRIIEALLFVHPHPLSVNAVAAILEDRAEKRTIKQILDQLVAEYRGLARSFHLTEVAEGYQFRTQSKYGQWIQKLKKVRPIRLSHPAMETLAIVAYRQPTVRAEIEQIRGVDSGWVLSTLLEKGLIKILGRKEVPGRPLIYGTTRKFLEVFGIPDLKGLPTLEEFDSSKGDTRGPGEAAENSL